MELQQAKEENEKLCKEKDETMAIHEKAIREITELNEKAVIHRQMFRYNVENGIKSFIQTI